MKKLTKKIKRKLEKIKRVQEAKRDKEMHYESEKYVSKLKTDIRTQEAIKNVLNIGISFLQNKYNEELKQMFKDTLNQIKEEGKLYQAEYISMKIGKFNVDLLNRMGKKGWKFAFENDGKIFLTREIVFKEED